MKTLSSFLVVFILVCSIWFVVITTFDTATAYVAEYIVKKNTPKAKERVIEKEDEEEDTDENINNNTKKEEKEPSSHNPLPNGGSK